MRSRGRRANALAALLLVCSAVAACGPTAPAVYVAEPLPAEPPPVVQVTAAKQKDAIVRALRAAGVQIGDHAAPYLLRVTLGVDQGSKPCGTLNNVRYAVRREGRTLLEVTAKGWTGTCVPNVFDEASQALQRQLAETGKGAS